jgi:hypothetical protein
MLVEDYLDAVKMEQRTRKKLDEVCNFVFNTYLIHRYPKCQSIIKNIGLHRTKIHDDYFEFSVNDTVKNMSKQNAKKLSKNFFIAVDIINVAGNSSDVPTILAKTTSEQDKKNTDFWMALEEKVYIFTKNKLQKRV